MFRDLFTVSFVLQQVRRQKSITVCKANILKNCYPNSVSLDKEEIGSRDHFEGPIKVLLSVYAQIVLKLVGALLFKKSQMIASSENIFRNPLQGPYAANLTVKMYTKSRLRS